ncbi:voltage-gated Ion Channel superfamily [Thecamonas trahens ATCC 50062]|uniref:Calcium-channel protein CCH1 n=1 Tax=Thecamonas trahens ATCC 50062 TaxID=461836 RepID=A0A0L0DB77_THETB|nr:voltage-gated Ion Channel superfamily [Thecamonas trahens ATCC 50062]KNC49505.1 voltage-gated Ion Channel superfamily [Thecamonas trahens ATCC 50062]|eukprot:XP_013757622.1 voltage-gated Ion Channel superfamily [Thecamonas trahens ATCC 50062]
MDLPLAHLRASSSSSTSSPDHVPLVTGGLRDESLTSTSSSRFTASHAAASSWLDSSVSAVERVSSFSSTSSDSVLALPSSSSSSSLLRERRLLTGKYTDAYGGDESGGSGGRGGGQGDGLIDESLDLGQADTSISRAPDGSRKAGSKAKACRSKSARRLVGHALCCFSPTSRFRRNVAAALDWPWTDRIILFCILVNTVTLTLTTRASPSSTSTLEVVAYYIDLAIGLVFTIEMLARLVVLGGVTRAPLRPCGRRTRTRHAAASRDGLFSVSAPRAVHHNMHIRSLGTSLEDEGELIARLTALNNDVNARVSHHGRDTSYFRDPWNVLDAFVVATFWLAFADASSVNFSAFRAFRALRPMRALKFFAGIRTILDSLRKSWTLLLNVVLFLGFFFSVYGIVGISMFGGSLSRRCLPPGASLDTLPPDIPPLFCSFSTSKGTTCPEPLVCTRVENPSYGFVSFDNIWLATLTMFIVMTLEGWSSIMYSIMQSEYAISALYFISLIIFLSFLVVNLFVAVIVEKFGQVRREENRSAFSGGSRLGSGAAGLPFARFFLTNSDDGSIQLFYAQSAFDTSTCWGALGARAYAVIASKSFEALIFGCILANLVLMASAHDGMPEGYATTLYVCEFVFTIVFAVEMVLKIIGRRGIRNYCRDPMNVFDGLIVVATTLSLLRITRNLSFLRVFRVLRITRLLVNLPSLVSLLKSVLGSLRGIANLMAFMAFSLVTVGILGMQLYAHTFDSPADRANFDNFPRALLSMFMILAGDAWPYFLFNGLLSPAGWFAPLFFIGFYIFGVYVLLNLFVAVILENFEMAELGKKRAQLELYFADLQPKPTPLASRRNVYRLLPPNPRMLRVPHLPETMTPAFRAAPIDDFLHPAPLPKPRPHADVDAHVRSIAARAPTSSEAATPRSAAARPRTWLGRLAAWLAAPVSRDPSSSRAAVGSVLAASASVPLTNTHASARQRLAEEQFFEDHPRYNVSLGCLGPSSKVRAALGRLLASRGFWLCEVGLILASSLALSLENVRNRSEDGPAFAFYIADVVFFTLFALQASAAVTVHGLFFTPHAYLASGYNRLDLVLLIAGGVHLATARFAYVRLVRYFRALRPLRIVSRSAGMRRILRSLFQSRWDILNVCLLMFGFLSSLAVAVSGACVGSFVSPDDGVLRPRAWRVARLNFDHIGAAFVTLFSVASLEGWWDVMYDGMDVTAKGVQPATNASAANALYFVAFVFLGSFFMLNLFVSVIINNFSKYNGRALLTDRQRSWLDAQTAIRLLRPSTVPPAPHRPVWRSRLYEAVTSRAFEHVVASAIVVNMTFMMSEQHNQGEAWTFVLFVANLVFTILFALEALAKVTAFGLRGYLRSYWNCFDGFLVLGSLVLVAAPSRLFFTAAGRRFFRIARIFRLVRHSTSLHTLFQTVVTALPAVFNVASLFFVLMFVYATLGSELFGATRHGAFLNANANFESFGSALLLLFRMVTGEDWQGIMLDCAIQPPLCTRLKVTSALSVTSSSAGPQDDCGSVLAYAYFISFFVAGAYVMLNMFIAVILENFSYCSSTHSNYVVAPKTLDHYKRIWALFDRKQTGLLTRPQLRPFLYTLGPPLGLSATARAHRWDYRKIEYQALQLRQLSFSALLKLLILRSVDPDSLRYEERAQREMLLDEADAAIALDTMQRFLLRYKDVFLAKTHARRMATAAAAAAETAARAARKTSLNFSHSRSRSFSRTIVAESALATHDSNLSNVSVSSLSSTQQQRSLTASRRSRSRSPSKGGRRGHSRRRLLRDLVQQPPSAQHDSSSTHAAAVAAARGDANIFSPHNMACRPLMPAEARAGLPHLSDPALRDAVLGLSAQARRVACSAPAWAPPSVFDDSLASSDTDDQTGTPDSADAASPAYAEVHGLPRTADLSSLLDGYSEGYSLVYGQGMALNASAPVAGIARDDTTSAGTACEYLDSDDELGQSVEAEDA